MEFLAGKDAVVEEQNGYLRQTQQGQVERLAYVKSAGGLSRPISTSVMSHMFASLCDAYSLFSIDVCVNSKSQGRGGTVKLCSLIYLQYLSSKTRGSTVTQYTRMERLH